MSPVHGTRVVTRILRAGRGGDQVDWDLVTIVVAHDEVYLCSSHATMIEYDLRRVVDERRDGGCSPGAWSNLPAYPITAPPLST